MPPFRPVSMLARVRILLVSSLYPGPEDPDYGIFVQGLVRELERQGHAVERAVVDRRGGSPAKQVGLARPRASRRFAAGPTSSTRTTSSRPARSAALAVARRPRAARRDRARPRRPERRHDPRRRRAHPVRPSGARRPSSPSPTTSAASSSNGSPRPPRKTDVVVVRRRPRALRAAGSPRPRAGERRLGGGRAVLPLRRDARRAQERRPARRRVRAARARAASPSSATARAGAALEGRPGVHARRPGPARAGRGLGRRLRRPLPAERRRAVRDRAPRGDGRRALGGRDEGGRPAGVRPARGRRARRPDERRVDRDGARGRGCAPEPEPGRARGGRRSTTCASRRGSVAEILARAAED